MFLTDFKLNALPSGEERSLEALGELIGPRRSSETYDPIDVFEVTDNSLDGVGEDNRELKFYVEDNSDFEDSDNISLYNEGRKKKRLKTSSDGNGRRSKGGRTKHEVWVNFKETMEGKSKVAECLKCRKTFRCPQADRLLKHVQKCSTKGNEERKRKMKAKPDKVVANVSTSNENSDEAGLPSDKDQIVTDTEVMN